VIRPRVVVAGNLSLDDTVNPNGTVEAAPGGDALYAALAVRGWGAEAVLLTLVGDDYPAAHFDRIRAAGIDMSRVRAVEGPTVHYRVTNGPEGERVYEWISSEDRLLATSPAQEDYSKALDGADWLHVAAMPIEPQETAVDAARAASVGVSLDPHEEYIVGYETRVHRMVDHGPCFMPSELEARLLLPELASRYGDDGLAFATDAAERFTEWSAPVVAIKLGSLGSVVRFAWRTWHVPALRVPVVDPTGAGDAYCGGFLVGLALSGDARIAGACGTVSAAETLGSFGAFPDRPMSPALRLERLDTLLREVASDGADGAALLQAADPVRELVESSVEAPA
jgi:ribokinase